MAHIPMLLLLLNRSAKQWGLFKVHLEVESVIIMVLLTTLMHMATQRPVRNALTLLGLLGVGR
jgi:type III secretory pathway component EscT